MASSEFIDAAAAQGERLGFVPASTSVAHPIQDRTDEELRALADGVIDELISRLTVT